MKEAFSSSRSIVTEAESMATASSHSPHVARGGHKQHAHAGGFHVITSDAEANRRETLNTTTKNVWFGELDRSI